MRVEPPDHRLDRLFQVFAPQTMPRFEFSQKFRGIALSYQLWPRWDDSTRCLHQIFLWLLWSTALRRSIVCSGQLFSGVTTQQRPTEAGDQDHQDDRVDHNVVEGPNLSGGDGHGQRCGGLRRGQPDHQQAVRAGITVDPPHQRHDGSAGQQNQRNQLRPMTFAISPRRLDNNCQHHERERVGQQRSADRCDHRRAAQ